MRHFAASSATTTWPSVLSPAPPNFFGRVQRPQPNGLRLLLKRDQFLGRQAGGVVLELVFYGAHFFRHESADSIAQHLELFRQFPGTGVGPRTGIAIGF